MYDIETITNNVTILNGESLSNAINLAVTSTATGDELAEGRRLFGIVMPATWTTANLTFQASYDGGTTWVNVYDSAGTELTVTAAASRLIVLDPATFAAVPMLKVRSGTSGTAVNQGGDRALGLVLRAV